MTKRFIPVLAACLFLMVGTAQAATSLAFPPPDTKGGKPLMQTLSGRATNRSFTAKPLSDKLLGDLLWAAYGVNRGHAYGFRLPERGLVLRLRGAAQCRPRFLRRRRPRFRPRPPQLQAYPDFPKHRMGRIEKSIP